MALLPIDEKAKIEIASWYRKRGQKMPADNLLPPSGLWVPGLAAAWLIKTDIAITWIEHLITNPDADPVHRANSLDQIIQRFFDVSDSQGNVAVFGFSKIPQVIGRKSKLGFETSDLTILVRKR